MVSRRAVILNMGGAVGMTMLPSLPSGIVRARTSSHGYWLPEEAEPHLRTFMQWPVSRAVYPDPVFLEMLQRTVSDVANTIAEFEPVIMLMDESYKAAARKKLSASVTIWNIPTEDLWCRDAGPVFVRNHAGDLAVSHLNFNGWGNKQVHRYDGQIARWVAEKLGLSLIDNGLVGEAGGVESDGEGTLLAHESSWIIENRNKGSKQQVEKLLLEAIGGKSVIWAPGLKNRDITDYHIDALARFASPGTVVIQLPEKPNRRDPWSVAAFETYEILTTATDAKGRKLELVVVPEPYDTRVTTNNFVASYVNYYVCNGAVVAAQFGDRDADLEAVRILKLLYPGREVVTLDVDPIGETGGGIHCATQQQPAT